MFSSFRDVCCVRHFCNSDNVNATYDLILFAKLIGLLQSNHDAGAEGSTGTSHVRKVE